MFKTFPNNRGGSSPEVRRVEFARLIGLIFVIIVFSNPVSSGSSPWDPDDVTLLAHEMAQGVFAVLPDDAFEKDHVATTGGFVVGDKGVLVIDSMLNHSLATQLIKLVRKVTDKPILYLVNTSYHGDHSYGNFVFPNRTEIIQHPATKAYVEIDFEADRAFMLKLIGRNKGIEDVSARSGDILVQDHLAIDLGGKTVVIQHFGFAQTAGDLVVWLPAEQILWVGNMIQAPEPALPWLLEGRHKVTISTLKKIKEFLPDTATIIPGHGKPMTKDGISFGIRYLKTLSLLMQEAIDNGVTLERAVATIRMPEYENYSLYAWAHQQVNIPAAHHDLLGPKSLGSTLDTAGCTRESAFSRKALSNRKYVNIGKYPDTHAVSYRQRR